MAKRKSKKKNLLNKQIFLLIILTVVVYVLISIALVSIEYPGYVPQQVVPADSTNIREISSRLLQEKVSNCLKNFPKATERDCTDIAYHDFAVSRNDISLCQKISNTQIKEHCVRSL
jgi:hypothetical protein